MKEPLNRVWPWAQRLWAVLVAVWIGAGMRQPVPEHPIPDVAVDVIRILILLAALAVTAVAFALDLREPRGKRGRLGTLAGLVACAGMLFGCLPELSDALFDELDRLPALQELVPIEHFTIAKEPLIGAAGMLAMMFAIGGLLYDQDRQRSRGVSFLIAALAMLIAALPGHFVAAHGRAYTRACYAKQKTIVGAMEMYNLDHNARRTTLNPAFFSVLRSGGYLREQPCDPGFRSASWRHYRATSAGNGITCERHGSIQ